MAKLVLAMFTSLDGYIAGPNGEFISPPWSEQVSEAWARHNLDNAAHLIYGRAAFQFNQGFWTSPIGSGQAEAGTMNRLPKTVVSRSMSGEPGWNATLVSDDLAGAVEKLKASVKDGDIYCFGGAGLANSLMRTGLIDDYYLMVTPTIMGDGMRLFDIRLPKVDLELVRVRAMDVGSIIVHYQTRS